MLTATAWAWLAIAAVLAVGDWTANARGSKALEYVCKPATMVALIGAALALEPVDDTQRACFVVALVLSMAGDVFLMLPERRLGPADTFTFGLGAFLLGHLAYIAGFVARGDRSALVVVAIAGAAVIVTRVAPPILRGAKALNPRSASR